MGKLYLGTQEVTLAVYDKEESVGITRAVDANGVFGYPTQNFTFSLPSDATDLGSYALYYAFQSCRTLTSADLSSLTAVSNESALNYAFFNCTGLTSVDSSSLATVYGTNALNSAFRGCTSLASANFSSLTSVSGNYAFYYAFYGCQALASINFSSLAVVTGSYSLNSAFYGCRSLTSVSFPALATLTGAAALANAFQNCSSLASLSFPALTASSFGTYSSQFNNMLKGCSNVTVHFPAAIQSTIGGWTPVIDGFGGTNTTVLFDL